MGGDPLLFRHTPSHYILDKGLSISDLDEEQQQLRTERAKLDRHCRSHSSVASSVGRGQLSSVKLHAEQ